MSTVRRVLFAKTFGLLGALSLPAAKNAQAMEKLDTWIVAEGNAPRESLDYKRWDKFYELMRVENGWGERQERLCNRLHMPPHLYSMNSTAPWWRQMKALEFEDKLRERNRTISEKLMKLVGLRS